MSESSLPRIDRSVPRPVVWMMTFLYYGIGVPLNWVLTKLGLGSALVSMMSRTQTESRLKKVFRDYEPTSHDVFVSTFSKSGTNWMMQIAHQIAFRGSGEYENIHDVVSWPDLDVGRRRKTSISLNDPCVQQVANFLGVDLTSAEMDRVIEKSSFSYMSKIDDKFAPMPKGTLPWSDGFRMMRQGKEGSSHEMLSLEQQIRIDEHFQKELADLGSDFPYAEFCRVAASPPEDRAA